MFCIKNSNFLNLDKLINKSDAKIGWKNLINLRYYPKFASSDSESLGRKLRYEGLFYQFQQQLIVRNDKFEISKTNIKSICSKLLGTRYKLTGIRHTRSSGYGPTRYCWRKHNIAIYAHWKSE